MSDEAPDAPQPPAPSLQPPVGRFVALLEVLICSDYPTQLAIAAAFMAIGFSERQPDGGLSVAYVATLSLIDAVLLIALIIGFLRSHGESPRRLFFGSRAIGADARLGLSLAFAALAIAFSSILIIQQLAPWLRTQEDNPLQALLASPGDAAVMAIVLVVAGGLREEVQRAFLLNRFERWLGGPTVGVLVTSAVFGTGHILQGLDVALVTALLGAFWAVIYLRRRSIVAPVVSHAGFNLLQLGLLQLGNRMIG